VYMSKIVAVLDPNLEREERSSNFCKPVLGEHLLNDG
jgi:hypothetical protein